MSNYTSETTYALFRSPHNQKLISELEAQNAHLLVLPQLGTERIEQPAESGEILRRLADFDWLIFPDVCAVDYFIEIMEELEIDLFELDEARICAFGEAVSDRLRFARVHADVIPAKLDAATILNGITDYVGGEMEGLNFLVVSEQTTSLPIVAKLKENQASLEVFPVYRAGFDDEKEITKLKTLLKGGAADEFIFSSAEDVLSFRYLFPSEEPAEVLNGVKVSALNEQVFLSLLEINLRPLYYHPK